MNRKTKKEFIMDPRDIALSEALLVSKKGNDLFNRHPILQQAQVVLVLCIITWLTTWSWSKSTC